MVKFACLKQKVPCIKQNFENYFLKNKIHCLYFRTCFKSFSDIYKNRQNQFGHITSQHGHSLTIIFQKMQVQESIVQHPQNQSAVKQTLNDNGSSKIWSQIASSRVKETKEIIEITEEKASYDASSRTEVKVQKQTEIAKNVINPAGKPLQNGVNRNLKWNDDLQNPKIFSNNKFISDCIKQQKQSQQIHKKTMEKHFQNRNVPDQLYKEIQIKLLDSIIKKTKNTRQEGQEINVIRFVDLLQKKFIKQPNQLAQQAIMDIKSSQNTSIYKRGAIFCQRLYFTKDQKSKSQASQSTSKNSQANSFKRSASGRTYANNCVSLVENQSTNYQVNDDLEALANNYVNSIRKGNGQLPSRNLNPQHKNTVEKNKKQELQNSFQNQSGYPFEIKMPTNMTNKKFQLPYSAFQSQDEQKSERFNQERLIAKTFVKDGYGLSIVRKYMGPSIQGGGYNRAITTIIRQSYKKIEEFLSKQCNIKIHNMTSSEFSLIKTPLVHCRNILKPEDLRTYFKFIAITYSFGKLDQSDYPTAQQTLNLYNSILRGLSDRKSVKQTTQQKGSMTKQMFMKF